jgi:hypothetical protein
MIVSNYNDNNGKSAHVYEYVTNDIYDNYINNLYFICQVMIMRN